MSPVRVSPRLFLRLCQITLVVTVLNVVTGAAVRLSDSGLGCPDWPTCSQRHLTPPLSLHPVVEFGNRVVVTLLVVSCAATVLASLFRRPRRRDLAFLSGGLILGVIGEAVLGGFVVYSKLNPYVVGTHFLVGMALLGVSVELTLRAGHAAGRGTVVVSRGCLWLGRLLVGMMAVVLAAGSATTGTGPHAGGKGAKRIPLGLEDMTRIHAEIVLSTITVLVVLLWLLWKTNAPPRTQTAGQVLLIVAAVQGAIGYIQFFSHLPALLVGIHVFGASMVWSVTLWLHHRLSTHAAEGVPAVAVAVAGGGPAAPVVEPAPEPAAPVGAAGTPWASGAAGRDEGAGSAGAAGSPGVAGSGAGARASKAGA